MNKYVSTPIIINAVNEILVDHFLKKKISFTSILNYSDKIGVVVAFGNNSKFIYDSLSSKIHVILYKTLNDAMKNLKSLLNKSQGDIVFSPGCPSYDEFSNFEERGDFFKNNVFDVLPS